MAADNTSFLTPLLTSCGVIAGFLSARHQHISSLIRKKTEYIFCQYHESKPDLSEKEIENMMAQIVLFYERNKIIEIAVYSALAGGIIFALNIVIFHESAPNTFATHRWMIALVILGIIALALSLCLAINEFSRSSTTLDLEIILAGSKTRPTSSTQVPNIDKNLSMYGTWKDRSNELVERAKKYKANEKWKDRRDKLLERAKKYKAKIIK